MLSLVGAFISLRPLCPCILFSLMGGTAPDLLAVPTKLCKSGGGGCGRTSLYPPFLLLHACITSLRAVALLCTVCVLLSLRAVALLCTISLRAVVLLLPSNSVHLSDVVGFLTVCPRAFTRDCANVLEPLLRPLKLSLRAVALRCKLSLRAFALLCIFSVRAVALLCILCV